MTKNIRQFATVFGLSALLGTAALVAQSSQAVATIPSGFHVKDTTLPAGTYTVTENRNGVLAVRNDQSGRSILVMTRGRDTNGRTNPRMVFKQYGSNYYLSQVWLTSEAVGLSIPPTAHEKELAKGSAIVAEVSVNLAGE